MMNVVSVGSPYNHRRYTAVGGFAILKSIYRPNNGHLMTMTKADGILSIVLM